ncbi:MAG: hypothetical protein IJ567_07800 [Lachnospiraceae bacterium]|nr:hypothetical protein [Lachnospiraceae bacterium]
MRLSYDILLDENAFQKASADMTTLMIKTQSLQVKMKRMYHDLATALDTPAGRQLDLKAEDVLIQPIENLMQVIKHISESLTEVIGTGHYKDVFIKYEQLNETIKFN